MPGRLEPDGRGRRPAVCPPALQEAVRKAATNSVGSSYDVDRRIMETLSDGTPADVGISDLVRRYAVDKALITDVAVVAADLMVAEAEAKLALARSAIVCNGALLAGGIMVTGLGFLVLRRRVTQPLAALVSAMLTLAARDTSVGIPGTRRQDE